MKKAMLLSIIGAGIIACSGDAPFSALDDGAALRTVENQLGGEAALLEYEVQTLVIRYTESHGPLIDSNRVRFSEYEDGFTWSQIDQQVPAVTSGTTLDGTSIHYAGAERRGGWSANPQATYLPRVDNTAADIDRGALRAAIRALPWVRGNSSQPNTQHGSPNGLSRRISWRSPVAPHPSAVAEKLQALRSRSEEESRVSTAQIRFRLGKTAGGHFVDAIFDERIGEVVEQTAYKGGAKSFSLTRDYHELTDGYRLASEVFESYGSDGETLQRVERTFFYADGSR